MQALQSDVDAVCDVQDCEMYEGQRYMVMQLLGENLSTLRKGCVDTQVGGTTLTSRGGVGCVRAELRPV